MITDTLQTRKYYQALLERDSRYDGIFFAAITTTGIFCHATCPARKPKYEHCLFYETAQEALLAGFRPCKRCQPLSYPREIPDEIKRLVDAVEAAPEKRWKDADFQELGLHSATARRHFKKIYGMTFVQYARARRLGIAFKSIRQGHAVLENQLNAGYQSSSGFNDAFSKIMGDTPKQSKHLRVLYADWFDTPLGPMISIADHEFLYLLEFTDRRGLEREIERLRLRLNARIIPGKTAIHEQISTEMSHYFNKTHITFETPLYLMGSPFQQQVWKCLQEIPAGTTLSYKDIAHKLGNPKSVRAVGNTNGANQLCIIIPCHRVVQSNGELGGYGGGVERKQWLLQHEKSPS